MKVREIMTREVACAAPGMPLKDAVRIMATTAVSGLPVVDDAGTVVGVVSEADLLLKEAGEDPVRRRFAWLLGEGEPVRRMRAKVDAARVEEAMTAPAVTVDVDDTVRTAAQIMVRHRINRLPVVQDGRLAGIVSRADVARVFLRSDEEIRHEIETALIRRTLWPNPAQLHVAVADGVVSLSGTADRRSTAEAMVEATRRLDGVVAVSSSLRWALDDTKIEAPDKDLLSILAPRP
jgi:CBS domain-containing protein